MQEAQTLRLHLSSKHRHPRDVAAWLVEIGNQTELHGIAADREDDGDCRGCRLGCERRGVGSGEQHGDLPVG